MLLKTVTPPGPKGHVRDAGIDVPAVDQHAVLPRQPLVDLAAGEGRRVVCV